MSKIKSLKHPPKVTDAEVQLAINKIYNEINTLITSVNKSVTDIEKEGGGKAGDIRVTTKSDRSVVLEIRTSHGGFETVGLTMIDKRG